MEWLLVLVFVLVQAAELLGETTVHLNIEEQGNPPFSP